MHDRFAPERTRRCGMGGCEDKLDQTCPVTWAVFRLGRQGPSRQVQAPLVGYVALTAWCASAGFEDREVFT